MSTQKRSRALLVGAAGAAVLGIYTLGRQSKRRDAEASPFPPEPVARIEHEAAHARGTYR